MTDAEIRTALAICEKATQGPMSYEWIAEKSNGWAVGQAWDLETNKAIDGPVDDGQIDDRLIERRALLGMNESRHANIYDAKLIAMVYSPVTGYATALRALLEARAKLARIERRKKR